ncbi:hypothetical protein [Aeromonas phage AerS_266]|nr:hypothetical protein [Aeromonas phage AerS_266]
MDFSVLEKYANNPSRIIPIIFNGIEQAADVGGGQINATGHPFSYAIDLIIGTNYSFISRLGDSTAKTYQSHARNLQDLSKVMSDEDWVGVFSEPSGETIRWIIGIETLEKIAKDFIEQDGALVNTYKKLELPPDTQFFVAGIPFLLENPVEIRIMEHGGIQVVYDSSYNSPFKPLTDNSPDREIIQINGSSKLAIHLPVRQLEIKEYPSRPVNVTSGYRETITFNDKLFGIRAFITPDGSNTRQELSIVYNNEIFDPNQPTLVIDMIDDNNFQASIPTVYLQNETALGRLTILTYTTRGALYQDLSTLRTQEHTVAYYDYRNEKGKLGTYSEELRNVNEVLVDSLTPITGGKNGSSFEEIKNMVIYGYRRRQIPISNSDFSQALSRAGFDNAKSIDTVSRRIFRTTKNLPIQENKLFEGDDVARFNSSIGTYTGSTLTSIEELVGTGNAIDNGRRITILRGCVYDITEQTPRLVPLYEINALKNASNQVKIDTMGNHSMVYLPFMYVIDITNDRAEVRCYRVAKPEIRYQTFRYENATLGMQVSVGSINIVSDNDGYTISLETKSTDTYKQLANELVGIQLSFSVEGSTAPAVMKGTLLGKTAEGERVFQFKIPSRFDVDALDTIDLKNFNQFGRPQDTVRVNLEETANFIFTYSGDGLALKSATDFKIDQTLFNNITIAIIETEYKLTFGQTLNSLYTRIRPMVGEAQYEKYLQGVPETYLDDTFVYENGKLKIVDGKAVIEHRKGEVVYNTDGSIRWKHLAGTTVYDENGEPVLLKPRELKYHWDFIGFDFNYLLSEDDYDGDYVTLVEDFFAEQVDSEVIEFNKKTLDETKIVFKPRSTMGFTQVILNENITKTIRTDIRLAVTYYLTTEGMSNEDLKQSLKNNTHKVSNEQLSKGTFSVSELTNQLRTGDAVAVKVTATAGIDNVDVITNIDETNGFSIRKVLDQTSDRLLTIKEDIEITFKAHIQNK